MGNSDLEFPERLVKPSAIVEDKTKSKKILSSNRSACLTILTEKNLCFTEFSTKIHWNTGVAASDVFRMFTQSINFF